MTTIAELLIADPPEAWQAIGLDVDGGGDAHVGMVRLRFDPTAGTGGSGVGRRSAGADDATAIRRWTLAGAPARVCGTSTASSRPTASRPGAPPCPVRTSSVPGRSTTSS